MNYPFTVAFFVNIFPKLSETFILRQIIAVAREEINFQIFSLIKSSEEMVHESVKEYNLLTKLTTIDNPLLRHQKLKFDIIHCHFGTSGVFACNLKRHGIIEGRLLTSFHGFDVNVDKYNSTYYSSLIAAGDYYTANTNYTKAKATALGFNPQKIDIIPEGVDCSFYAPSPRQNTFGRIRILTVGRLVEKKGIIYAIKAIELLERTFPGRIIYDIIGEGPLREELQDYVFSKSLAHLICFHGVKTEHEVVQFLKSADVFVLPSIEATNGDSEGQGLVLQEAQAMEIPVVSTLHNGIKEGVKDNITGYLVPERNFELLADRIGYLIEHPDRRLQMGREGREFVKHSFESTNITNKLLRIYTDLYERR